jgi:hypothetical protein
MPRDAGKKEQYAYEMSTGPRVLNHTLNSQNKPIEGKCVILLIGCWILSASVL